MDNIIDSIFQSAPIDLDRWNPQEAERSRIMAELWRGLQATSEVCGPGEELTAAFSLCEQVNTLPLADCKDVVQQYFLDYYHAVDGRIAQYYHEYPELMALMRLTLNGEALKGCDVL